ncbi:MAG: hypothetical protein OXU61_07200 [Gammaproteobacteria bacterium]|nr:hypothetical protein [Gammaproteobacteria bacterium]
MSCVIDAAPRQRGLMLYGGAYGARASAPGARAIGFRLWLRLQRRPAAYYNRLPVGEERGRRSGSRLVPGSFDIGKRVPHWRGRQAGQQALPAGVLRRLYGLERIFQRRQPQGTLGPTRRA